MNEKRGGGPNLLPLVIVPVAMMLVAKAAHRRRRYWAGMWGAEGGPAGRHGFGGHGGPGHHARHGWGGSFEGEGGRVNLPPKIEAILDAWHTQAHAEDSGETTSV